MTLLNPIKIQRQAESVSKIVRMTRKEVIDEFGVSLLELQDYIKQGKLSSRKIDGKTLFLRIEVEQLFKK